ncbi:MAG: ferredoxin [Armatimonadetes bacterium]|nr:ferredoxin [Armatimonadota bacterium]
MKAKVDPDLCIGCELCVSTAPEIFKMEDDKAVAYIDIVPKELEEACRQSVDECPVSAIIIED